MAFPKVCQIKMENGFDAVDNDADVKLRQTETKAATTTRNVGTENGAKNRHKQKQKTLKGKRKCQQQHLRDEVKGDKWLGHVFVAMHWQCLTPPQLVSIENSPISFSEHKCLTVTLHWSILNKQQQIRIMPICFSIFEVNVDEVNRNCRSCTV